MDVPVSTQVFLHQRQIHHLQPLGSGAQPPAGSHGNSSEKSPLLRVFVILDIQKMPGGLRLIGENEQAVRMFADQLVDDWSLKISLKALRGQAAIHHMKRIILAAAREQDRIIDQRLAGRIWPAAHAERLVFALVVEFLLEQLFKAAQIPQVLQDIQNRLLSFDLGHSTSLGGQASLHGNGGRP